MENKTFALWLFLGTFLLMGSTSSIQSAHASKRASSNEAWFNTRDFSDQLWLYVPSTGAVPRYVQNIDPFFQGEEKIVRLHWHNNAMQVIEEDRDRINQESPRWQQGAPVLTLPVEYLSKEHKKTGRFFYPLPEQMSVHEYNQTSWFEQAALEEQHQPEVVRFEMDPKQGSIQIELKRTYRVKEEDAIDFYGGSLSDLTFTVPFYYSLVRLDKVASTDYEPIRYAPYEKNKFGFFHTKHKKSDAFYHYSQGTSIAYLNRFNPKKSQIDYYLSDTFFKPENKVFLETTLSTFQDINDILQETGVPYINLVNFNQPMGISAGDIRYNIINLIDEPLQNRLLGYAPAVANPLTGEIIKGQVNQYAGTIINIVPRVWNELVRLYNRQQLDQYPESHDFKKHRSNDKAFKPKLETISEEIPRSASIKTDVDLQGICEQTFKKVERIYANASKHLQYEDTNAHFIMPVDNTSEADSLVKQSQTEQARLHRWSTQNAFAQDYIWTSATAKGKAQGIDYNNPDLYTNAEKKYLKKWHHLNPQMQEHVAHALKALIYRSTLVHEFGHNLGLRHNFKSYTDHNNFYTAKAAQAQGYTHPPAYTSIMDYAPSEFDNLKNFGPYDLAALRFGYKREVNFYPSDNKEALVINLAKMDKAYLQNDEKLIYGPLYTLDTLLNTSQETTLPLKIKSLQSYLDEYSANLVQYQPGFARQEFAYCTDEDVFENSGCERHAEGRNIYETVLYREQRYWDSYESMFTRNNREQFTTENILYNTVYQFKQLSTTRDLIEQYALIDNAARKLIPFPLDIGEGIETLYLFGCDEFSDSNICHVRNATHEAGNFLLDLLARPDKICEFENAQGDIQQAPLTTLYDQIQTEIIGPTHFPFSCFTPWFASHLETQGIKMRSETKDGWALDSVHTNNPNYPKYHELDTAGAWIDKLLAMQFLAARGSVMHEHMASGLSLLDLQPIKNRFIRILETLALGKAYPEKVLFIDRNGQTVEPQTPYRWNPMQTVSPLGPKLRIIAQHFDIETAKHPLFIKEMLKQLVYFSFTRHPEMKTQAESIINLTRASDSADPSRHFTFKEQSYTIGPDNFLAWEMSKHLMVGGEEVIETIDDLPKEDFQELLEKYQQLLKLLVPKPGTMRTTLAKLYSAGVASAELIQAIAKENLAGKTFADMQSSISETELTMLQLEQIWQQINHIRASHTQAQRQEKMQQEIDNLCQLSKLIEEQRASMSNPIFKRLWNNKHLVTSVAAFHDLLDEQASSWLDEISYRLVLLPTSETD